MSAVIRTPACPIRFCRRGFPRLRSRWPRSCASGRRTAAQYCGRLLQDDPDHIRQIAGAVQGCHPDGPEKVEPYLLRLSGLEALTVRPESNFVNVGERTNITGSPAFSKLILAGDYDKALTVARQQVEGRAQIIDINMDEGLLDSKAAMQKFPCVCWRQSPTSRAMPIMVDSSKWEVIERASATFKERHRQFHQPEGRRPSFWNRPAHPSVRSGDGRHGV